MKSSETEKPKKTLLAIHGTPSEVRDQLIKHYEKKHNTGPIISDALDVVKDATITIISCQRIIQKIVGSNSMMRLIELEFEQMAMVETGAASDKDITEDLLVSYRSDFAELMVKESKQ